MNKEWRKTEQYLLPEVKPLSREGNYDIYPSFKMDDNQISEGFELLAELFLDRKQIIIDGYIGVFFDYFREKFDGYLIKHGVKTAWKSTLDFLKPPDFIEKMVSPFLGGDDPLFGTRTTLNLEDFFDPDLIRESRPDPYSDINIIIGPGASFAGWK